MKKGTHPSADPFNSVQYQTAPSLQSHFLTDQLQ